MKFGFNPLKQGAIECLKFVGAVAIFTMCGKFNIPVNFNTKPRYESDFTVYFMPRNSTECAIFSIFKSTEKMYFDSNRIDAANKIRDIISNNSVSDETLSFAVMALCNIAENMDFDSNRNAVNDIVSSVTKGDI